MEAIKKLNHNAVICVDNNGNELIAFGKGIGFPPMPYDIDVNQIEQTYYNVNPIYYSLFNEIPAEIFSISIALVNYSKKLLLCDLNPNLLFTLADHINFSVNRYKKNISFKVPFTLDVEYFYEKEILIGKKAVAYINKKLNIRLPNNEAVGIALHLINSENNNHNDKEINDSSIIQRITKIIETKFEIKIDKKSFNYSRFVSHMHYLLKRSIDGNVIHSDNAILLKNLKETFPLTYECALHIRKFFNENYNWNLNDEELLYLMLHINRLCSREECNI